MEFNEIQNPKKHLLASRIIRLPGGAFFESLEKRPYIRKKKSAECIDAFLFVFLVIYQRATCSPFSVL